MLIMEITLSKFTAAQAAGLSAKLGKYIDQLDYTLHLQLLRRVGSRVFSLLPLFLMPGIITYVMDIKIAYALLFTLAFGAFVFAVFCFLADLFYIKVKCREYPERYELLFQLSERHRRMDDLRQLLLFGDVFKQIEDENNGQGDQKNGLHDPARRLFSLIKSGKKINRIDLQRAGIGRNSDLADAIIKEDGQWDFSSLDDKLIALVDNVNALCGHIGEIQGVNRLVLEQPTETRPLHHIILETDPVTTG